MLKALNRLNDYESWYQTLFATSIAELFPDAIAAVEEVLEEGDEKFKVILLNEKSIEIIHCLIQETSTNRLISMKTESCPLNRIQKIVEEYSPITHHWQLKNVNRKVSICADGDEPIVTIEISTKNGGWRDVLQDLSYLITELKQRL